MWLLLYVDDMVLTGNNPSLSQHFITALGHQFEFKDLGPQNYVLGLQVNDNATGMHLSQVVYAHDLLQRANMLERKPSSTPVAAKLTLSAHDGMPLSSPTEYRMLVGCLQFLTLTPPDISFAVNNFAQFISNPLSTHMMAVKRILPFTLKAPFMKGLLRPQGISSRISAYSDSDWAWCVDTRRSTTDYLIYHGTNLVSWCSKKQPTVSRSSAESKYRALSHACAETSWLTYLFHELRVCIHFPVYLHCDNLSATYMAANPVFHAQRHHIETRLPFCTGMSGAGQPPSSVSPLR